MPKNESPFKLPENRHNLQLFHKLLSQPLKGLLLCQAFPEERLRVIQFFHKDPLAKRIHTINMVKPIMGPMALQDAIINASEKFGPGKNIFFIFNIESCIYLSKITAKEFYRQMNLIRDFFMKFDAAFVFFVTESSLKEMIQNAFDFYDWMKFTFTFEPENKSLVAQELEQKQKKYSQPSKNIEYLERSLEKITDEKEKSIRLFELGKLYHQMGNYDRALERIFESLEIEEKYGDPDIIAGRYNEIGLIYRAKEAQKGPDKYYKSPSTDISNFKWEELLDCIKRKNVIPVIGQGLYRVETESGDKNGRLLYDYLADRLLEACGIALPQDESHRFAKACYAYLKFTGRDYLRLTKFLRESLEKVRLSPSNPLLKLARIKNFGIFFTTAYDDFLAGVINNVRTAPLKALYYAIQEISFHEIDKELFNDIHKSLSTLLVHIFGNIGKTIKPAFTEMDILETLMNLGKDMNQNLHNLLFQALEAKSLLFIGCGYDDWLYRLFIRTMANKPFSQFPGNIMARNFVVDDFSKNEISQWLPQFLVESGAEVYHTGDPGDFVDLLFEKLEERYPEDIIQPVDFPIAVFISHDNRDRAAAHRLASHLQKDEINVWLDDLKLKPGMDWNEQIIRTIDRCRVFIPLISENSRRITTDDGRVNYHVREWEQSYTKKGLTIIPVKIDDSNWMYDKFANFPFLKIPGGQRRGNYRTLVKSLKGILSEHVPYND
ncbi:MAG: TIR domain-containing protein [Candidatus Aminicenantes bacterium]|nr:TIR domain-containing protein [Candidatus Aminicenantes bacterium]